MIARYVTHLPDEFEPNKGVCYGQIGTYVRVHYQIDHTLSCTIQLC